jgi:hypothetical protein
MNGKLRACGKPQIDHLIGNAGQRREISKRIDDHATELARTSSELLTRHALPFSFSASLPHCTPIAIKEQVSIHVEERTAMVEFIGPAVIVVLPGMLFSFLGGVSHRAQCRFKRGDIVVEDALDALSV